MLKKLPKHPFCPRDLTLKDSLLFMPPSNPNKTPPSISPKHRMLLSNLLNRLPFHNHSRFINHNSLPNSPRLLNLSLTSSLLNSLQHLNPSLNNHMHSPLLSPKLNSLFIMHHLMKLLDHSLHHNKLMDLLLSLRILMLQFNKLHPSLRMTAAGNLMDSTLLEDATLNTFVAFSVTPCLKLAPPALSSPKIDVTTKMPA